MKATPVVTDLIATVSLTVAWMMWADDIGRGAAILVGIVVASVAARWSWQWARWWQGADLEDVADLPRRATRRPWVRRRDRDQ